MPCYTYITDDGEQVEHSCSVREYQAEIQLEDGRIAKRDYKADFPTLNRPLPTCWPMKPCISTGVNVAQEGELRNFYKKHNLPIEVKDGNPIYTSQKQMEKDFKLRRYVDKN